MRWPASWTDPSALSLLKGSGIDCVMVEYSDEFEGIRTPEEIRACTDAILGRYDDVPVRSFVLTLVRRGAKECLRADVCDALEVREAMTIDA